MPISFGRLPAFLFNGYGCPGSAGRKADVAKALLDFCSLQALPNHLVHSVDFGAGVPAGAMTTK